MCRHVQCHDGSRQQCLQTGWCRLSQQLGLVSSGWALTTGADTSEPSGSCSSTVCYHHLWPPRGVSSIRELAVFQVETEQLGHWQQPKNQQKSNEWGSSRGMLAGTVRMESNSTHQVERPHPICRSALQALRLDSSCSPRTPSGFSFTKPAVNQTQGFSSL